ncbi:hypothetical protein JK208_05525 [Gluconobacter sp. Dm-74]|uniref:hypothetical protein n=1 Tax=Gluconobacter sp. Dm-74 TaxID=2799803 RepID=UPI001B8AE627|nr:hypothetical protein [Gluconobacter sp. Dm-74]MBS1091066.1 hypothetical protein [Gluconobacter sp. Dm-74]
MTEIAERVPISIQTVQALFEAQDIGSDEVRASNRWYREFIFATQGITEGDRKTTEEKGNVHTWMLSRGKCSARIADIKERLGLCAHIRLEMMLARGMSFSQMARMLYPGISESRSRMKVSAQCALVLEQLAHVYANMRRAA